MHKLTDAETPRQTDRQGAIQYGSSWREDPIMMVRFPPLCLMIVIRVMRREDAVPACLCTFRRRIYLPKQGLGV